ncbi:TRAP transporter [Thioclava sp. SK-1]|uniref:TRAP transporter small permease n=1 Tax=Thioclava sp. SK-1 TaxID=1889770 RepID=UPI000827065A|nr:TRAP transporter small permease subunit [Thioclava sp. SK-1]OCX67250.1 TRAP transporter [Thioclava sp. SK-1]
MTGPTYEPEGAFQRVLHRLDVMNWRLGGVFLGLSNACLLVMLFLTTVTIIARPLGWSAYWIWPWTMVFFVWLSFFGFFAIIVRLKDVRIDFLAQLLGPKGFALTRTVADLAAIGVCVVLLMNFSTVMTTSRGVVDGAILPNGVELPRQALSVPLFLSAMLVLLTGLLDLAKQIAGLPENISTHHPEA